MNIIEIISKKRDGLVLSEDELEFFVNKVTDGTLPDYQTSAMLMAMYIKGLNSQETANLTLSMAKSGDMLDLSEIDGVKVDKHSTGGVADTTTLILVPLIACCDVPVIKMSGRGLGFTGGTIDKLESIPGFNVEVKEEDVVRFGKNSKVVVMGQSENLTPADKKLYALRDVTATVDSMPLIAASIMSKKLAAGADAIVLDVKCGSGAFMKDEKSAMELAKTMVDIGKNLDRKVVAVISNMSQPLGNYIGNSLEVIEAIETLKGNVKGDLLEVTLVLGANMLMLSGKVNSLEEGIILLESKIYSGEGLKKFQEFIEQQGGNSDVINDYSIMGKAKHCVKFLAEDTGFINRIDSEKVGKASVVLGAGRITKADRIDYNAGIIMLHRVGDKVAKGQVIFEIFTNDEQKIPQCIELLKSAISIGDVKGELPRLILNTVE